MRPIQCWQKATLAMFLLVMGVTQAKAGRVVTNTACGQTAALAHAGSMTLDAAVQHIECQSADRRLLIVGELHGTSETPALVTEIVKAASKDRPVRVGLEWPAWMQDYVVTYLASQGSLDDRKAMLRMGYWRVAQDGRDSKAMVDLVDTIRVLRKNGRDVDIFLMEPNVPTKPSDLQSNPLTWKENGMARAIETALGAAPPKALVVAYMGNVHSRYVARADHPQPSVLQQVIDDHPLYVVVQADAGSAWNCQAGAGCGPHMFKAPPKSPSQNVKIDPLGDAPNGVTAEIFDFPVFTASAPSPRFEGSNLKAHHQ